VYVRYSSVSVLVGSRRYSIIKVMLLNFLINLEMIMKIIRLKSVIEID